MFYKSYQHIEKLGTMETEGILVGKVHLSYKIDGTNACAFLNEEGGLGLGSRKRDLAEGEDNAGFREKTMSNEAIRNALLTYLRRHPSHILYGEWLIPMTIKRYKREAWENFYIFDVLDLENNLYIPYEDYVKELEELGLSYVPEIAVLENPAPEDIASFLPSTGNFLLENGLGEGIVIKNYDYHNRYGRQTWAKILTEDFSQEKRHKRETAWVEKGEFKVEHDIANLLTKEHVYKEKAKIEEREGGWSDRFIFELLNRVFLEFWRDNGELIIFKKMKLPTINFKQLKKMCDSKTKDYLGL